MLIQNNIFSDDMIKSYKKSLNEKLGNDAFSCLLNSKYEIIYLDWNIIKMLKNNGNKLNYNQDIVIPFSCAHLEDLYPSLNDKRVLEDLQYLSLLSKNKFISTYEVDLMNVKKNIVTIEDGIISNNDVYQELKKNKEKMDTYKNIQHDNFEPYPFVIEYPRIVAFPNSKAQEILEKNNFIFDSKFYDEFNEYYFCGENNIWNNPATYKEFRMLLQNKTSRIESINLDMLLNLFSEKDINNLKKDFILTVKSFNEFQGIFNDTNFKILSSEFHLLDFSPIFSDKMSKKNKLSNIQKDNMHLQNLIHSNFFVTNDKSFLNKITFLLELHPEIKTKILTYDELLKKLM